MADRILILGASARAAAASARRAGLEPLAVDLFADADTKRICECLRCPFDQYPDGLFRLARTAPPMPWMYTGGLENHPDLIGALAKERELRGNGPEPLAKVRDPHELHRVLAVEHGLACPAVVPPGMPPAAGVRWLRKPTRGSAGRGIGFATEADGRGSADHYLQEFITGSSFSSVFFTGPDGTRVVGSSRQLVGVPWLHASPFAYSGSVLPFALSPDAQAELLTLASRVVKRGKLKGCWGVDSVLGKRRSLNGDADLWERPYLVEVNPRYPASAELFELTSGAAALDPTVKRRPPVKSRAAGKVIYFAPRRLVFPASGPWDDSLRHAADVWHRPDFADIPNPGEVIEQGQPVVTILTEAASEAECLRQLQSRAADLDRLFGVTE